MEGHLLEEKKMKFDDDDFVSYHNLPPRSEFHKKKRKKREHKNVHLYLTKSLFYLFIIFIIFIFIYYLYLSWSEPEGERIYNLLKIISET